MLHACISFYTKRLTSAKDFFMQHPNNNISASLLLKLHFLNSDAFISFSPFFSGHRESLRISNLAHRAEAVAAADNRK